MQIRIPELNKRSGVRNAVTNDGVELPIVDITHPTFSLEISDPEVSAGVEAFMAQERRMAWMPQAWREWITRQFLMRSTLGKGILRAQGSFLDGTTTYLFKVGPANLGKGYSTANDQILARGVPAISMRLRLQDMARLLVEGLAGELEARPRAPLHFLDIAGGPAVDCLNALILLQKTRPELLAGRQVTTHVLDLDADGPAFGQRALEAFQAPGAPLYGLDLRFEVVPYHWSNPEVLTGLIASFEEGIFACSSEGGLFEYGTDDEIVANLRALKGARHRVATVVGSVTRAGKLREALSGTSRLSVKPRTVAHFESLANQGGWRVEEREDRPMNHDVRMVPA
jgi:hypothetical protein